MKKVNKPLFIIDTSQQHGRGTETHWISCTSSGCPFVAKAQPIDNEEYQRHYDPQDHLTTYSEPRGDIRMMVSITNINPDHDQTTARNLLKKALKEIMKRKQSVPTHLEHPSDEAVISFISILQGQNLENLRTDPACSTHQMVYAILRKIKEDYETKINN